VEKLRDFKVAESSLNLLELSNLINFCKTFEKRFAPELINLIEYKMEIVERTTYYVQRLAIREFVANMLFVTTKRNLPKLAEIKSTLAALESIKSAKVHVHWKIFEAQPIIPTSIVNKIAIKSDKGLNFICNNCQLKIEEDQCVGVCRQCNPVRIFC
jgi:Zn finger protein HypA/HybF involved in hydrogenase expression